MDYHELHKRLWNWIADKTLELKRKVQKWEYFMEMGIPVEEIPENECYACEECNVRCSNCPINWSPFEDCISNGALFDAWFSCKNEDYETAAALARKIANLPWREDENNAKLV